MIKNHKYIYNQRKILKYITVIFSMTLFFFPNLKRTFKNIIKYFQEFYECITRLKN